MHDTSALAVMRISRAYRERVLSSLYRHAEPLDVAAWPVPGEPVPFEVVAGQTFTPIATGAAWGPPWGTTWLRVTGVVPREWPADAAIELVVDLGFIDSIPGFQAEGLVWTPDGRILKGLEPRNDTVPLDVSPGERIEVLVEAASNPNVGGDWSFSPTPLGDLATTGSDPLYRFGGAELRVLDRDVFALERDWATLAGLLEVLPPESTRRARVLRSLERAVDVLDPQDVAGTAVAARAELAEALASPAVPSAHRVVATGHAHIDSAWLWPVRETIRKCARTFGNVVELMDRYPDLVFSASSAQQYAWMKEHYPELFERIRRRVAEGRFVPVGGMWVESDTNLPGGEAMARQFVAGKGFFLREFGLDTREVWLPDSFGYSGALPQIVVASGSEYFLTQKISWNETNRMPHHSFLWEGIDGTRVFTHFPPVDTYNSDLGAVDLARAERQHAEKGASDISLVPFGFGDGGGGPTREMVEAGRRAADLEGSPRVRIGRPDEFFDEAHAGFDPPVWSGELYLEYHRGTYTSQARTKLGNRRSEHLLREAELWAATAAVRADAPYPAEELRRAWETVLLQQFHDILPGSSIAWVHQEAERNYAAVAERLEALVTEAFEALGAHPDPDGLVAANASPLAVDGVAALAIGALDAPEDVRAEARGDGFVLESSALSARFDAAGHLVSLADRSTGRDAVPPDARGNELQLFADIPNRWDAWDIDAAYHRTPVDAVRTTGVAVEGDALRVSRTVGGSAVEQHVRISSDGRSLEFETAVDWSERQKLLKLAFPFDVHAATAASEVQFGHVRRATHVNTSWDMARFETAGHRWVHVDEPGFGVTVANDRVYGHDVTRTTRAEGGTTTTVRESLLRAPLFPDPHADQGVHVFRHAIRIGSLLDGVGEGYRLNLPTRRLSGMPVAPLVVVEGEGILVEAVKLAEDGSGDVVIRLYEARGARSSGRLVPGFPVRRAWRTDLLERPLEAAPDDALALVLRPFEIVTLRLAR
jgi:alpha-mannosidase